MTQGNQAVVRLVAELTLDVLVVMDTEPARPRHARQKALVVPEPPSLGEKQATNWGSLGQPSRSTPGGPRTLDGRRRHQGPTVRPKWSAYHC